LNTFAATRARPSSYSTSTFETPPPSTMTSGSTMEITFPSARPNASHIPSSTARASGSASFQAAICASEARVPDRAR
jgi:hypothetical protein